MRSGNMFFNSVAILLKSTVDQYLVKYWFTVLYDFFTWLHDRLFLRVTFLIKTSITDAINRVLTSSQYTS